MRRGIDEEDEEEDEEDEGMQMLAGVSPPIQMDSAGAELLAEAAATAGGGEDEDEDAMMARALALSVMENAEGSGEAARGSEDSGVAVNFGDAEQGNIRVWARNVFY